MDGECIAVCRLENATLKDLVNLTFEIFKDIPKDAIICYGSASHLYRVGASVYAQEWAECNNIFARHNKGITILPLIPVIKSDCPGNLSRDIEQWPTWVGKVYENDVLGLLDSWRWVLHSTNTHSTGAVRLEAGEIYKNPMPATFDSTKLEPHCFVANSSSPAQLSGLDRKASDELIRVFIENLKKNFSVPANPENFLARDNTVNVDAKDPDPPQTYIVIGSSIMGKVAGHLQSRGHNVIDLSIPGWVTTSENVEGLVARLSALKNVENFAIVLDLHSNSTFRFLQFDGTLALPVKEGKKYHYPGELRTVTDDIYKKITAGLQTVLLSAQKNTKILIPPLPRYVFCKCCGNPAHVTNFEQDRYKEKILDNCTHLRKF
jgi:hypothetical protein